MLANEIFADDNQGIYPTYTSEWVQPPLNILDKFTVKDVGPLYL